MRQIADNNGNITLARNYDPFGKTAQTIGTAQTDYGFTGEFTDASGLINLRARHYSPTIGRFLTRDTWAGNPHNPETLNRYSYAHNNPVLYTDPSGHFAQIIAGAAFGALLGGALAYPFAEYTYTSALNGKCGCQMQQWAYSVGHQWVGETVGHAILIGAIAGAVTSTGPVGMILVGSFGVTASAVDALRTAWQGIAQGGFDVCMAARFIADAAGYIGSAMAISARVNTQIDSDIDYQVNFQSSQFGEKGYVVLTKEDYASFGNRWGSNSGRAFVTNENGAMILKQDMSLGDISMHLGKNFPEGSTLYMVEIDNVANYNLRLPTGGNENFAPGGFTLGGLMERIIDPIDLTNRPFTVLWP